MCNLYSDLTTPDWIKLHTEFAGSDWHIPAFNKKPLDAIFPDQVATVVLKTPKGRELVRMRWGFPSPPKAKSPLTTNVRNTASSFWKPWLKTGFRCLVPVSSFCEPDWRFGKHVPTWFALDKKRSPFFFAGIWRPWTGTRGTKAHPVTGEHLLFAFQTTRPNAEVAPVHEKAMPVLLLGREACEFWLMGSIAEALALQQPAPDGTLRIVATGSRRDGIAA